MTGKATLIFETSTPQASICTFRADGAIDQRLFTSDRSHNAVLFTPLKELLDGLGAESPELVIVGSGPGSYSGTRVGIAAAQGVAIASGCPAVAVPSILGVPVVGSGNTCLAIGDARRGSYWTAKISDYDLPEGPELTDLDGLRELVSEALSGGAAVFSFEDPARFPLPEELVQQVRLEFPTADRLWQAWLQTPSSSRSKWSGLPPQPIYLKPPHITPAKRSWLVPS